MNQPIAQKVPFVLETHGHQRIDPYYWLNQRENPEVLAYLEAENTYLETELADTKGLKEALFEEMKRRTPQTDMSVPYFLNGYWYYSRFEEGQEYPLYCRKEGHLDATEEVLLDVPALAVGHSYYTIGGLSISPDNNYLAYGVDTVSRRIYTIHFKDLSTGHVSAYTIPNTTGSAVWANDNQTVFYQVKDPETLRAHKIFKHKKGTDTAADVCVFHETDDTFSTFVYKTKSRQFIVIGSHATVSNEYRFVPAHAPDADFQVFHPRERHLEYSIDHIGDYFYILTNLNAQNFCLMRCLASATTSKEAWEPFIDHRPEVLLENTVIFKEYLVTQERENGLSRLCVRPWNDIYNSHYVDFGEAVYSTAPHMNPETETQTLRLHYTSLTTPNSVYDYNMATRTLVLKKQEAVLDPSFNTAHYHTERVWATAQDGVKVPISLVYNKNCFKKADNPLLLYAYGSYGHSMDVYFSSPRLSLLDRGFVYAIAHIRGGEDLGRTWYEDGKLLKKKNTFTDFIDCGRFLVEQGYAAPDKLTAMGGSAGGLLMGAVINMAPQLWRAVVAAVPFVDVVTTMLDTSIPLTTGEFDEWGNPQDKIYYDYMLSYSPYDNVTAQDYPALLVTTGLHDSQVQYFEPAKWVAKLRDQRTNTAPLYLYCNMSTGHGGASGRFERYRELALEYAFLLKMVGLDTPPQ